MSPRTLERVAGVGALLGGLSWLIKSTWILAGREEPAFTFELPFVLVPIAVLAASWGSARPAGPRRLCASVASVVAVAAGAALVATEATGVGWSGSVVAATVAMVVGLLLLDRRGPHAVAWWSGALLLPAVALLGGALSLVDERLLELPLALVALAWAWWGVLLLRPRRAPQQS